ncbi:MAG: enoyl-CoA hydratase/isomerase family protein [Myxococcales bacterium]|nr:enoyl-CoA hydratase/isomerase family protein [Myxococcales bacterium]
MISPYETVLYEHIGRTIRITLNRPEKRNALNAQLLNDLTDAFERADQEPEAGVIVLRGAGDKAFCAGADLGGMASGEGMLDRHDARGKFPKLFNCMLKNSKVILAAVNGHCLAGGLGLMLACDLAIACEGSKFGTPEVQRGLFPFMISALILRTVARRDAYEIMLLGELFSCERALELGLVNRVAASEKFDPLVEEWAQKLASLSPAVLRLGRRSLINQEAMSLEGAFDYLHGLISINSLLEDAAEGVSAFFEKRPPKFTGR